MSFLYTPCHLGCFSFHAMYLKTNIIEPLKSNLSFWSLRWINEAEESSSWPVCINSLYAYEVVLLSQALYNQCNCRGLPLYPVNTIIRTLWLNSRGEQYSAWIGFDYWDGSHAAIKHEIWKPQTSLCVLN